MVKPILIIYLLFKASSLIPTRRRQWFDYSSSSAAHLPLPFAPINNFNCTIHSSRYVILDSRWFEYSNNDLLGKPLDSYISSTVRTVLHCSYKNILRDLCPLLGLIKYYL